MTAKKQLVVCIALVVVMLAAVVGFASCQRIAVYSVTLNETYLEMNVGDTSKLTATVDAENVAVDVTWSSAHTNIVTVDNGVVTAVSAGATSIKAAVQDKVAVCTVVVKSAEQQGPSGIVLDTDELNLEVGQEQFLYVTAWMNDITSTNVKWQSLNNAVATVNGGIVKGVSVGFTCIIATYGDKQAVCKVNVGEPTLPTQGMLTFNTFTDNNGIVTGKCLKDSVNTFDFNTEITAGADVSYIVCTDIECTNIVRSKIVSLQDGFNRFYILATRNNVDKLYQVAIEIVPSYKVIINTEGCDGTVAVCEDTQLSGGVYEAGQNVTVKIKDVPLGYAFDGLYDGEYYVTFDKEITFAMPANDLTYTAKFHLDYRIENLDFESTPTTFKINGFKQGADDSELVIPEYTTEIKPKAFSDCTIKSVRWLVPQYGGRSPFTNCTAEKFELAKSVTKIGNNVFFDMVCRNVYYQGVLTDWLKIEFGMFNDMFDGTLNLYFNGSAVTEIVVPEGITEIKKYAFEYASFITDVKFPSTLKKIDDYAFYKTNITSVVFPLGLEHIGSCTFGECKLENSVLILPSSLKHLDSNAFSSVQVDMLVIPSNITYAGGGVFYNSIIKNVLFEGSYAQWTAFTKVLQQNGYTPSILSAKLYTKIVNGVADNPSNDYWEWSYAADGIRVPYMYSINTVGLN